MVAPTRVETESGFDHTSVEPETLLGPPDLTGTKSEPVADRPPSGPAESAADLTARIIERRTEGEAEHRAEDRVADASIEVGPGASIDEFLQQLSRIADVLTLDLSEVRLRLEQVPQAGLRSRISSVLSELIGRGVLTSLQSDHILRGDAGGLRLGPYLLLGRLGQGGMGVVYEAKDVERDQVVALKVLPRVDAVSLHRFKREFRARADVTHPNLVRLYELLSEGERWGFSMEKIEGKTFHEATSASGPSTFRAAIETRHEAPSDRRPDTALTLGNLPTRLPPAERPDFLMTDASPNWTRIRSLYRQLADGLIAIHDAGLIHRDIKPSNVLVKPDGTVVILDFGLVAALDRSDGSAEASANLVEAASTLRLAQTDPELVGTIDYMSPEQAGSAPLTAASDWYAVGVMLFETLTGRRPYQGTPFAILRDKRRIDPPRPKSIDPSLPDDLEGLCVALLDRNPAARPSGLEVLSVLAPGVEPKPREQTISTPFVGREEQLALLERAADAAKEAASIAFIRGASGMGKSTLVERFLKNLPTKKLVVLAGRCYEQETVPFKAIDAVVDALARYLKGLSPESAAALPDEVADLARMFPTLRRIEEIDERCRNQRELPNPRDSRQRAFAAFRKILANISERARLVIAIDDFQWGDVESARLIEELTAAPSPPRMLLLLLYRSEYESGSECLELLKKSRGPESEPTEGVSRFEISADPLSPEVARSLAFRVLDGAPGAERLADAIVRSSAGVPFFVVEFARRVRLEPELLASAGDGGRLDLDALLWSRFGLLPEPAKRLLTMIAVASRPIAQRLACEAAEVGGEAWSAVASLRSERLARSNGLRPDDEIVTFHDRIREAVIARLHPDELKAGHGRLATVLERDGSADDETLAAHFMGAEMYEHSGVYYERAADHACRALAFDRAVKLYDLSRALLPRSSEEERAFRLKQAEALALAGRGADAGNAYRSLAEGAEESEAVEHLRRAATHFTASGMVDDGRALWNRILAAAGHGMPSSPRQGFVGILVEMLRLNLGGMRFQERANVPADRLKEIDLLWAVSLGLGMTDTIPSHLFKLRGLRLSLKSGDPARISRSMSSYAAVLSDSGTKYVSRARELLRLSESLAKKSGDPYSLGMHYLSAGVVCFQQLEPTNSQANLEVAREILTRQCRGATWEIDTCNLFDIWVSFLTGDVDRAERSWKIHRADARERGDLYLQFSLEGPVGTYFRLNSDDPEGAQADLDAVLSRWSREGFQMQHVTALDAQLRIDRYSGEHRRGWERCRDEWRFLENSLALRSRMARSGFFFHRASAALSYSISHPSPRSLVKEVESDVRRIQGLGWSTAAGFSEVLLGGLAERRNHIDAAIRHYYQAIDIFGAVPLRFNVACLRLRLSRLVKDAAVAADLRREAEAAFEGLRVKNPERASRLIVPELQPS